jgi:hypothetical protein
MQIAYLTTDEVNLDGAAQTASECGAALAPLPLEGVMPGGPYAAVLFDLDHYDSQRGRAILMELLSRPTPLPVGLHGYSLAYEEMAALRANGVVVSQHFDPEMVRTLCRAADRSQSIVPVLVEDHQDSSKRVDDPSTLCAAVRSLASRSYLVVRQATGSPVAHGEVAMLLEQIDHLEQQVDQFRRLHKVPLEDVQSWIRSLRRRVGSLKPQPS